MAGAPIVALAGGVGAARFLQGLAAAMPQERIIVIGNTGDDLELHGLYISPDLDTVTYTLAGVVDEARGWGLAGDTFSCLDALARFSPDTWFRIGDRDLATHLFRSSELRRGRKLSEATAAIGRAFGLRARLLPMTDDRVRTRVVAAEGVLDFQAYFVQRRAEDEVRGIIFDGSEHAEPAPGVLAAIRAAAAVIICPSNPIISIGPILAVPGIRDALQNTKARVAAISPIVGGRALKGPADRMMRGLGLEASARQVADLYRDFVNIFILDCVDAAARPQVEAMGMTAVVTQTVMGDGSRREGLARQTLEALGL